MNGRIRGRRTRIRRSPSVPATLLTELNPFLVNVTGQSGYELNGLSSGASNVCALGVRRAKAALSSGCKPHPATAPAGSNRSSYGGDEIAEAFGMRATNWWQRECAGRNASERRASLEKDDAQADPTTLSGKADTAGGDP